VMEEAKAAGMAAPKSKPALKSKPAPKAKVTVKAPPKKATVKAPPKRKAAAEAPLDEEASLDGKLIAFTGTLQMKRAEAKALAEANGAKVGSTVTSKTHILIAAADAGAAKTAAAEAKGVEVWSEEHFMEVCQKGALEEASPGPPAKAAKAVKTKAGAKRKAEATPGATAKKAKQATEAAVSFSARGVCESSSGGKFWTVSVSGSEMTTTWGKVGSTGQTKVKECASGDKAVKEAEKLYKSKVKGGYVMEEGDEEDDGTLVELALYLKEERAYDGTYNNEEWDEGILEEGIEAHILTYHDQLVRDPKAVAVAQQLESLEGISINNGSEGDFSWEPLVIAPPNGKAKLSDDIHKALRIKKSAGALISPLKDFKNRLHFWRSASYDEIDDEIDDFNECDSSWAAKVATGTALMQTELKDWFQMTFRDSVVVAPIMIGGYTKGGSIVAVMGTRVFT